MHSGCEDGLRHFISLAPVLVDAVLLLLQPSHFVPQVSHEIHELEGTTCSGLRSISLPWILLNNDPRLEDIGC